MEVVADDLRPVQLAFHRSTEFLGEVRIHSVSSTTRTNSVWFSTKGQVVIPVWLRKQFQIEDGARVVVQATKEGILSRPLTAPLIQRGRGLLQRSKGSEPLADEWAEHRKRERELEERHARFSADRPGSPPGVWPHGGRARRRPGGGRRR